MKTKFGFISNSSTTSFCIYGIAISSGNLKTFLNKIKLSIEDKYKESLEELLNYSDVETSELLEKCVEILNIKNLGYHSDYESDIHYLGIRPQDIDDSMTIGDFKKYVADSFQKYDNNLKPFWIEDSYPS